MVSGSESGKCCSAGCNVSTTYLVKFGGGDQDAGCQICGGQDFACVDRGGGVAGNPFGSVQDTNNATDTLVSIWASVQVEAQSHVDNSLQLLVNNATLVDFPAADYINRGCGTTADQCQLLSARTTRGQAYLPGKQNELSFQGNMCFTTPTLVVTVTQNPCMSAMSPG